MQREAESSPDTLVSRNFSKLKLISSYNSRVFHKQNLPIFLYFLRDNIDGISSVITTVFEAQFRNLFRIIPHTNTTRKLCYRLLMAANYVRIGYQTARIDARL